jgi:hypothetical protein
MIWRESCRTVTDCDYAKSVRLHASTQFDKERDSSQIATRSSYIIAKRKSRDSDGLLQDDRQKTKRSSLDDKKRV